MKRGNGQAQDGQESPRTSAGGVELSIRNRQRGWRVATRRLRAITLRLLRDELGVAEAVLGVHLIGAGAMARLNWRWLRHEGSTDIITFDQRDGAGASTLGSVRGECFISIDDAVAQAGRFGTTASEELVRYVVHGVLHLRGYDDRRPEARKVMKREENRLVRRLTRGVPVAGLVEKRG